MAAEVDRGYRTSFRSYVATDPHLQIASGKAFSAATHNSYSLPRLVASAPAWPSVLLVLLLRAPSMAEQNASFYYEKCGPSTCGNVTVFFPFFSSDSFYSPTGYEKYARCDGNQSLYILGGVRNGDESLSYSCSHSGF